MSGFSIVQKRAVTSAFAAVALHILVLCLWILVIIIDLPVFAYQPPQIDPGPEPEVTVVMVPYARKQVPLLREMKQPEPKEQPPKAEPLLAKETPDDKEGLKETKQRFARTTADQEGIPDADTDILGERNTRAASELPATAGAKPNTPAQDGAAPLYPGHVETVSKTYQEGSLGMDKQGEQTELPQEASASNGGNSSDDLPQSSQLVAEQAPSAQAENKHLAVGEMRAASQVLKEEAKAEEDPKKEESPRERPKEDVNDSDSKEAKQEKGAGDVDQAPKKDGFRGYSRQTRVTGSITRQGKSALNVRNSPLGRYQALISKAVELQWRRNCEQHRDHIVPGVISIRFYVDQRGGVSGIKFQEVIGANFIERGFTQRALRQVELPEMPKSVQEELKGESLELIYNFYF